MLEQFDEFSASVEIQDDALVLDRSTFRGLHAGNLILRIQKSQDCGVVPHVVLSAKP
jgi:hypothetical protein